MSHRTRGKPGPGVATSALCELPQTPLCGQVGPESRGAHAQVVWEWPYCAHPRRPGFVNSICGFAPIPLHVPPPGLSLLTQASFTNGGSRELGALGPQHPAPAPARLQPTGGRSQPVGAAPGDPRGERPEAPREVAGPSRLVIPGAATSWRSLSAGRGAGDGATGTAARQLRSVPKS